MRIRIRVDKRNSRHVHFTVFVNGANCGTLCVCADEFGTLTKLLMECAKGPFLTAEVIDANDDSA
jgi:hypothetical protein